MIVLDARVGSEGSRTCFHWTAILMPVPLQHPPLPPLPWRPQPTPNPPDLTATTNRCASRLRTVAQARQRPSLTWATPTACCWPAMGSWHGTATTPMSCRCCTRGRCGGLRAVCVWGERCGWSCALLRLLAIFCPRPLPSSTSSRHPHLPSPPEWVPQGVYFGAFPGRERDVLGMPSTLWVTSRPHDWHPATGQEWLLHLDLESGRELGRVQVGGWVVGG